MLLPLVKSLAAAKRIVLEENVIHLQSCVRMWLLRRRFMVELRSAARDQDSMREQDRSNNETAEKSAGNSAYSSPSLKDEGYEGGRCTENNEVRGNYKQHLQHIIVLQSAIRFVFAKRLLWGMSSYAKGERKRDGSKKQIDFFAAAARAGYGPAQYRYGTALYDTGIKQKMVEGRNWWRRSVQSNRRLSERGDTEAMYWLALCYHCGRGIQQDMAKGVRRWLKAADSGHAKAMYRLGWCHYNGRRSRCQQEESSRVVVQSCRRWKREGHVLSWTLLLWRRWSATGQEEKRRVVAESGAQQTCEGPVLGWCVSLQRRRDGGEPHRGDAVLAASRGSRSCKGHEPPRRVLLSRCRGWRGQEGGGAMVAESSRAGSCRCNVQAWMLLVQWRRGWTKHSGGCEVVASGEGGGQPGSHRPNWCMLLQWHWRQRE